MISTIHVVITAVIINEYEYLNAYMHMCISHDCYSPLEEYVLFPAKRPSDFQPPIGRMGYSSSRKGYVVVESDRDPTKEVRQHCIIIHCMCMYILCVCTISILGFCI